METSMTILSDNYANLKSNPRFMLSKKKVPYSYITQHKTSCTDTGSQSSYETIKAMANHYKDDYKISYSLNENDNIAVLDIDNCLQNNGEWSPLSMKLIAMFSGALIETSQSGRGLHIWFYYSGDAPSHKCKNSDLHIELYEKNRHIVLGNMETAVGSVTDCTVAFHSVINEYFQPDKNDKNTNDAEWTSEPDVRANPIANDDKLTTKARQSTSGKAKLGSGASFNDLYEPKGEVLADAYPPNDEAVSQWDNSRADAALALSLAWWTGNNCERILRLMWQSGLARDKWSTHKSYLKNTILNAVKLQNTFYGQANKSIVEKFTDTENTIELSNEQGYKLFENLHVKSSTGFTGDHYFDAIILLGVFYNWLVNLNGEFHYFNGRECQKIKDQIIRRYIARAMGGGDVKITQSRINGTLSVLKDQAPELGKPNPVSKNVYYENGVLNPVTGEFSEHNINNRNTSTLSVEYRSDSECPQFIEFLISTVGVESVQLVQEIFGWILCRDNLGIEKAALFIGPPRAGKGVMARLIFLLLSGGAVPFNLSELDDNKRLSGMRNANVAIDTDAGSASNRNAKAVMALFKIISSNEKLSILQLYTQTPWEGALNCKMLVLANSVPSMFDDSAATANRWVPVVFNNSFLGKENPNLFKQLSKELPGIAAWAVIGLRRLIERGHFELPKNSLDQLDSLISDGGSIQEFINECLIVDESQRASDGNLWEAYRRWSMANGREINKRRYMLKSLEDALRGNGGRRAKSVKLNDGKDYRGFYGVGVNVEAIATNLMPFAAPSNCL